MAVDVTEPRRGVGVPSEAESTGSVAFRRVIDLLPFDVSAPKEAEIDEVRLSSCGCEWCERRLLRLLTALDHCTIPFANTFMNTRAGLPFPRLGNLRTIAPPSTYLPCMRAWLDAPDGGLCAQRSPHLTARC